MDCNWYSLWCGDYWIGISKALSCHKIKVISLQGWKDERSDNVSITSGLVDITHMCTHACTHAHTHTHTHTHTYAQMYPSIHTDTFTQAHATVCTYCPLRKLGSVCVCVHACVPAYVRACVCVCMRVCICVCITPKHTLKYTQNKPHHYIPLHVV